MPNLLVFRPGTEDIEEYGWHGMLLTPWLVAWLTLFIFTCKNLDLLVLESESRCEISVPTFESTEWNVVIRPYFTI